MHMIPDAAPSAQPTTTARFRVEEHIIDAYAGPNDTLLDNPDLLVNATLTSRDVDTSHDRDSGWDIFHALVTNDPYRYRSTGGTRLVLVEGGDR